MFRRAGSLTTISSSRPNSIERVPIRIVLIEDNDVFREALELLLTLTGEIEVVGAAASGSRAVDLCRELSPDVLLVDYRLPGLDGVQVIRTVRKHCPAVAVVALIRYRRHLPATLRAPCLGTAVRHSGHPLHPVPDP